MKNEKERLTKDDLTVTISMIIIILTEGDVRSSSVDEQR